VPYLIPVLLLAFFPYLPLSRFLCMSLSVGKHVRSERSSSLLDLFARCSLAFRRDSFFGREIFLIGGNEIFLILLHAAAAQKFYSQSASERGVNEQVVNIFCNMKCGMCVQSFPYLLNKVVGKAPQ
jgi:hypothetical protein